MGAIDRTIWALVYLLCDDHLVGCHIRKIAPTVGGIVDRGGDQTVAITASIKVANHIGLWKRLRINKGERVVDGRIVEWLPGIIQAVLFIFSWFNVVTS